MGVIDAILGCVPGMEYRRFPDSPARDSSHERDDVPSLLAFLQPRPHLRILEIGCGRGVALPALAAHCSPSQLDAIDIDPRLLSEAELRIEDRRIAARLTLGDVRAMPYPDASFDLVAEIARVLAPGGSFAYETRRNQIASHPLRARLRSIPWHACSAFGPERASRDWATREKLGQVAELPLQDLARRVAR
jgi:SAM-dependent methyltransferase